jgi:hypothetical protein
MTPDQSQLVSELHRKVGHLPHSDPAPVTAGEVVRLINLLRMQERAADAAVDRLQTILKRAAEENLDTLLTERAPSPEQLALDA